MLGKLWKRKPAPVPMPDQPVRAEIELSDDDLEQVAGGLERTFPYGDARESSPGNA